VRALADSPADVWLLGAAKFPKMCDSLPRMRINQRAKFDATSFILGGEIRNRTHAHTQNYKKEQTVNDISIPSASVDNKMEK